MPKDDLSDLVKRVETLEKRLEELKSAPAKKKRDPRPPSDYNLFIKQTYAEVKEKNPTMPHQEIFAECARRWKAGKPPAAM